MQAMMEWLIIATTNKTFAQLAAEMVLPVFSLFSVFLGTSLSARVRFIGFLCGLASQPFWFYASINAYNLGLLINSTFFTALWFYRSVQAYGFLSLEGYKNWARERFPWAKF